MISIAKWCIIILEWESIIIFFIFLPRLHASSSSSSSHETPGGVEARRALTICNLVTFCSYQTYVRKKFFQKILENYLFLCYNHVRGGKGLALYETLGCVVFSLYNIYSKKIFLKSFLKKVAIFFFF